MLRPELGILLALLAGGAATATAAPLDVPQASVIERLAPAFATHDPVRLTMAYRAMGDYAEPAADIVEAAVNAGGYRLLDRDDIDAAIGIFELNVVTFPNSANAWDSLAEARMANGDDTLALRFYSRALELDSGNHHAAARIRQLEETTELRMAGAE